MPKAYKKLVIENESGGTTPELTINGVVEQYKVNAGATVNAGDFVEFVTKYGNGTFSGGAASYVSACKLDNSRVLVVYHDNTNSNYGTAIILSISDTTITMGVPAVFASVGTSSASFTTVKRLSSNKAIVLYSDNANSIKGTAVVLTISDTTITVGTAKVFCNKNSYPQKAASAVVLSENKVLVVYGHPYATAVVLTISDTTITVGTEKTFASSVSTEQHSATLLSENKVLVVYGRASGDKEGYAIVLTVSGTTISAGAALKLNDYNAVYLSVVTLDESRALLAYQNNGTGKAVVLTINGTTISNGSEIILNTGLTSYTSAVALSDSKVLVTYRDSNNHYYGTAIVLSISGTTITVGTEKVFDYNAVSYISLVAFSENSALVVYNNGAGAYSDITIDGTDITAGGSTLGTYVSPATSRMHNVGVAKTGGTAGETVDVYCVG